MAPISASAPLKDSTTPVVAAARSSVVVRRHARKQVAERAPIELAQAQAQHAARQSDPCAQSDALRDAVEHPELHARQERGHDDETRQEQDRLQRAATVVGQRFDDLASCERFRERRRVGQ